MPEPERKVVYEEGLSPPFEPLETPDEILSEIRESVEAEEPQAEPPAMRDESEERRRRRRRRRGRGGRERREGESRVESEAMPAAAGEDAAEVAGEEAAPQFDEEPSRQGEPLEDEAARGGRRRRRRRRGRGDRDRQPPRGEEPLGEPAESAERAEAAADDHDLAEHEHEHDHEDGDPDAAAGDKSLHRAIPSWQEAIGMIITVNMESRAKHPDRDGPRGRGGRDRGGRDRGPRDRGRRDRGSRDSGRGGR